MTLIGSKLITLGHKLNAIHKTVRMLLSPTYWRLRRMGGAIDGDLDPRNAEYPYSKIMGEDGGAALRVILPADRIDAAYSQSGNMCGGCMGAAQLYALTKPRKPLWVDRHSPMFVWWNARVYRGVTGLNNGVTMNNVMKALTDNGACDNALMPNYAAFSTPPSSAAVAQGLQNQATAYFWMYQSQAAFLDQVADALSKGLPVGVLMRLTWEWASPVKVADGAEVKSKTATSSPLFNHFMVVVGIDRLRKNIDGTTGSLLIKNSWGAGWGVNGTAWCSIDNWRATISSATVVTNREAV